MMVSKYDEKRFLLALQIDHSRVAGFLAAHWGNDKFAEPRPYTPVVLAAQEHDNGWWDWEIKPSLNEQGHPLDYINDGSFKYLGQFRLDFYKNGVQRVIEQDPYAGLLVLIHGIGLFNAGYGLLDCVQDRTSDPLVQGYIGHQDGIRTKLLEELRHSEKYHEYSTDEHIWTNYKLMEVFDSLAQFICNRYPLNSKERQNGPSNVLKHVPVGYGADKQDATLTIDVINEKSAVLRPYPFDRDPLEVSYAARLVPIKPYSSQEDFLRDYYRAERITVTDTLRS